MRTVSYTFALVSMFAAASAFGDGSAPTAGDYAGWAYFDGGMDLPCRLHLTQTADGAFEALTDNPVFEIGDIATTVDVGAHGVLTLTNDDVSGWKIVTSVSPQDDNTLRGRVQWIGKSQTLEGDVWLHRAAEPLPFVPTADLPDARGVYVIEPGRAIVVSRKDWGELFYTDTFSGRDGFLLPQSTTEFIVGEGRYAPTSIAARVTLQLNASGEVAALTWQDAGGKPHMARREEFSVEPIAFQRDGVRFSGQITRLAGSAPQPGVVVIGGSDWEAGADLGIYARAFAGLGLTVLTFDKRGYGDSGGDADSSFTDIAKDVVAAGEALAARPDVLGDQVGVFGYSRAGWHIPLACSESSVFRFAVMFVPPAVSPAEQEETRRMAELRASGVVDAADLELATDYLHAMWEFARTSANGERYLDLHEQISARGWADVLGGPETLDEAEWKWAHLNMAYDPIPALTNMRCAVLALFGGADANVVVSQNLGPMVGAFKAGGVADATTVVIEGANHGLQRDAPEDADARYHNRTRSGKAPEVWPTVRDWLASRIDLPKE